MKLSMSLNSRTNPSRSSQPRVGKIEINTKQSNSILLFGNRMIYDHCGKSSPTLLKRKTRGRCGSPELSSDMLINNRRIGRFRGSQEFILIIALSSFNFINYYHLNNNILSFQRLSACCVVEQRISIDDDDDPRAWQQSRAENKAE